MKHSWLPDRAAPIVRYLQDCVGEEEMELLASAINDINALAEEAVILYGRAHFLGIGDNNIELSLGP